VTPRRAWPARGAAPARRARPAQSASHARHALAALALLALFAAACAPATEPGAPARAAFRLTAAPQDDDRVYSVGRVQFRVFDDTRELQAPLIVNIDRATGVIDVDFPIPAGAGRRVLVEPLGSGILPTGDRTESGVALQGLSEPFDVAARELIALDIPLVPYIPDSLRILYDAQQRPSLTWVVMTPAQAHTVRVFTTSGGTTVVQEVPVTNPPVPFSALGAAPPVALQVRSENRFSPSAYSDTLVVP
jgi:hypothetical protein